ncbi:hypothetical protein ARMSODRAFT_989329 [Armillaria solidipes]|uniref:Reverse transcriptase zinc-binding domain-containing protein n=1 Tax=Armillaria solidipes TaxID=1076256 RepID=A0A2H3BS52_9AGAR|nr:hypothetical protein ARMSODRAFT_989329 [Armillaria solidipes]
MTQALAYQELRQKKRPQPRRSTQRNIEAIRQSVDDIRKDIPTDDQIWSSIRNKDITRTVHSFLWMAIHNAYKCGRYWENIPSYEHRGRCAVCNAEDSLEYVLLECDIPGQRLIWELAQELWEMKHPTTADLRDEKKNVLHGLTRLYRILITESAYLIWCLRCERKISRNDEPERWHTQQEIRNRLDCAMANAKRYGKKALEEDTVLQTWHNTLQNEDSLPDNWVREPGVLVGIGLNNRLQGHDNDS